MDQTLQSLIVVLLVLTSAAIATWKLLPARTKLRLLDSTHPNTKTALGRWLTRHQHRVREALTQGCGTCSQSGIKKHATPKH